MCQASPYARRSLAMYLSRMASLPSTKPLPSRPNFMAYKLPATPLSVACGWHMQPADECQCQQRRGLEGEESALCLVWWSSNENAGQIVRFVHAGKDIQLLSNCR